MTRKFTLVVFFITCKIAIAQSSNDSVSTGRTDENGWKQGYWIVRNDIKKLPDYSISARVEEGNYTDDKKTGSWKLYYPDGKVKSELTYVGNRPSGYAKMYYANGKLQEEGMWENNRWVGQYKSYYDNGQVFYNFNYTKTGKRDGKQQYFHPNGKLMMEGDMKEGKEAGTWDEYYEDGSRKAKKAFNDGNIDASNTVVYPPPKTVTATTVNEPPPQQPKNSTTVVDKGKEKPNNPVEVFSGNGVAKLYNMNRQISKDGEFKNYKLINGKDYIYSKDGLLVQIAIYKNGVYVGDAPIEDEKK